MLCLARTGGVGGSSSAITTGAAGMGGAASESSELAVCVGAAVVVLFDGFCPGCVRWACTSTRPIYKPDLIQTH